MDSNFENQPCDSSEVFTAKHAINREYRRKRFDVPRIQMDALMGFVADAINATILGFDIPMELKAAALRAFGKLLWVQNDLITRHYQR